MLKQFLAKVLNRKNLSQKEAFDAMEIIMTGKATQAQIGGYLVGLRMKGETIDEITGSASAMRTVSNQIYPNVSAPLLDVVGTGGDKSDSINISTCAAFVTAGAGYTVAKHGNRAASSKCGSADVLEALGVNLSLTPEMVKQCIEEVGIGFMFAPLFHPAMKHAIGPRRELGQRTIFNILGPLTNPANSTHQLVGVYDPDLTETMATVLGELGVEGAMVIHGHGGLDELTTSGNNKVSELSNGEVETYASGLRPAKKDDLKGGSPKENAHRLQAILSGEDIGPCRDVVLLNAAGAIATVEGNFETGLQKAEKALESGAALAKLEALVSKSQNLAIAA
jgi:anthranilate phosphoribosyltransferase